MSNKFFSVILAMSKNFGIGKNGNLPWNLAKELQHFKNITTNINLFKPGQKQKNVEKQFNAVIMGRRTFDSIPVDKRPLADRLNIVLSTSKTEKQLNPQQLPNLVVLNSLEESLKFLSGSKWRDKVANTFVIGGSQLFQESLQHQQCQNVFLTRIGIDYDCDVFVNKNFLKGYSLVESSKTYSQKQVPFNYERYVKKSAACDQKKKGNKFSQQKQIMGHPRHEEFQYLDLISDIIKTGTKKSDRTNVGTLSKFGNMMRFDLSQSFPLITTKNVYWRGVVEELLWFIKGRTNGQELSQKNVKIWDANGSRSALDKLGLTNREEHDLGPVYGFQWRHFGAKYEHMNSDYSGKGVDQLQNVINEIKNNPNSRRMILSAWNPVDLPAMALPPCHLLSQFYVNEGRLSCMMYQRSCDIGLGVPFNIASYSLLTCILAQICGLDRGEFIHCLGDTHIYLNHVIALKKQIKRIPNAFPYLKINKNVKNIEDFTFDDFTMIGYNPQSKIQMDMAL